MKLLNTVNEDGETENKIMEMVMVISIRKSAVVSFFSAVPIDSFYCVSNILLLFKDFCGYPNLSFKSRHKFYFFSVMHQVTS